MSGREVLFLFIILPVRPVHRGKTANGTPWPGRTKFTNEVLLLPLTLLRLYSYYSLRCLLACCLLLLLPLLLLLLLPLLLTYLRTHTHQLLFSDFPLFSSFSNCPAAGLPDCLAGNVTLILGAAGGWNSTDSGRVERRVAATMGERKSHVKSRMGCIQCKARRVKVRRRSQGRKNARPRVNSLSLSGLPSVVVLIPQRADSKFAPSVRAV